MMSVTRSQSILRASALAALSGLLLLTGCAISLQENGSPVALPGKTIRGNAHGGVFPIQNATIRLMETQSHGYGGAAKQLLSTTSDQYGYFTFPDTGWTCDTGQFAYITVSGGHASNISGATANNNVLQVGVIGSCSDFATQAEVDSVNVFVSELSTVAAAYALGNFISIDNTNASSGEQIVNISAPANNNAASPLCSGTGAAMKCIASGLMHAFTNAYNLVDSVRYDGSFPTGQARTANPSNAISGVPQQLINTMGNILQSCVDSLGGGAATLSSGSYVTDGSHCGDLFQYSTPPGGTAPTNTLQATMNMAKYPTNNISNLFNLQPRATFFTPDLQFAPTSYTISLFYGVTYSGSTMPYPIDVAVDAADNAYILYANAAPGAGTTTEVAVLSPAGAALGSTSNSSYGYPSQMAVDVYGNIFVTNNDTTTGALLHASYSTPLSKVATLSNASGVAIDSSNNVWVSANSTSGSSITEYTSTYGGTSTGTVTPVLSSGSLGPVVGLAIDGNENVWGVTAPGSGNSSAVVLANSAGSGKTPVYTSGGGITQALAGNGAFSLALNSSSTAFFPIAGAMNSATFGSGTIAANPNGTANISGSSVPHRVQVDGAGSLYWADREANGLLYMYTPPASGSLSNGTVVSFLPCYPFPTGSGYTCITTANQDSTNSVYTPSNLRGMAIDSAGDLWLAADAGYGAVIELLGLAAPTWPQLSYGHPGAEPQ